MTQEVLELFLWVLQNNIEWVLSTFYVLLFHLKLVSYRELETVSNFLRKNEMKQKNCSLDVKSFTVMHKFIP